MTDKEIVVALAEKVMGWQFSLPHYWSTPDGLVYTVNWNPLTSISDAWMVVEKMGGMWMCPAENGHGWRSAKLSLEDPPCEGNWEPGVYADEAPRAICLAALKAVQG